MEQPSSRGRLAYDLACRAGADENVLDFLRIRSSKRALFRAVSSSNEAQKGLKRLEFHTVFVAFLTCRLDLDPLCVAAGVGRGSCPCGASRNLWRSSSCPKGFGPLFLLVEGRFPSSVRDNLSLWPRIPCLGPQKRLDLVGNSLFRLFRVISEPFLSRSWPFSPYGDWLSGSSGRSTGPAISGRDVRSAAKRRGFGRAPGGPKDWGFAARPCGKELSKAEDWYNSQVKYTLVSPGYKYNLLLGGSCSRLLSSG